MKQKHLPVGAFKADKGYGNRILWEYRDRQGALHEGVVYTLSDAMKAAACYGFKLNGEGVTV